MPRGGSRSAGRGTRPAGPGRRGRPGGCCGRVLARAPGGRGSRGSSPPNRRRWAPVCGWGVQAESLRASQQRPIRVFDVRALIDRAREIGERPTDDLDALDLARPRRRPRGGLAPGTGGPARRSGRAGVVAENRLRSCPAPRPISSASSRLAAASGSSPGSVEPSGRDLEEALLADGLAGLAHEPDVLAVVGDDRRLRPAGGSLPPHLFAVPVQDPPALDLDQGAVVEGLLVEDPVGTRRLTRARRAALAGQLGARRGSSMRTCRSQAHSGALAASCRTSRTSPTSCLAPLRARAEDLDGDRGALAARSLDASRGSRRSAASSWPRGIRADRPRGGEHRAASVAPVQPRAAGRRGSSLPAVAAGIAHLSAGRQRRLLAGGLGALEGGGHESA